MSSAQNTDLIIEDFENVNRLIPQSVSSSLGLSLEVSLKTSEPKLSTYGTKISSKLSNNDLVKEDSQVFINAYTQTYPNDLDKEIVPDILDKRGDDRPKCDCRDSSIKPDETALKLYKDSYLFYKRLSIFIGGFFLMSLAVHLMILYRYTHIDKNEEIFNDICVEKDYEMPPESESEFIDFCTQFNLLKSPSDKITLLVDTYHWNLNEQHRGIEVSYIESLDNCSKFLGISSDGIRIWDLYSSTPLTYSMPGISIHAMSKSKSFLVFARPKGSLKILNIKTEETERLSFLFYYTITHITISDDEAFIAVGYQGWHEIDIYLSNDHTKAISLSEVDSFVKKIEFDLDRNDIIVSDQDCVKIYFLHSTLPAYKIKNLRTFHKLAETYKKLSGFESDVKESRCFYNH